MILRLDVWRVRFPHAADVVLVFVCAGVGLAREIRRTAENG